MPPVIPGRRHRVRAKRGPMAGSAASYDVQLHIGESITTIESMDSGSGPSDHPGMTPSSLATKEHPMQLTGIHHLTAISAKPRENLAFYTGLLGMRLVKKTVNQDDVRAYHLFYADGKANPGTDLTFFDSPAPPELRGTSSISRTSLRVAGEKSLGFWRDRLKKAGGHLSEVAEIDGRLTLSFEDGEGQRLAL